MDKIIAKRMAEQLKGAVIGGWTIHEKLGEGKSALVLRATRGSETGAVKVFDPELVQRFGPEAQRARGEREKQLVGRSHPNLIKILDAGYDEASDHFFVVMGLFNGKNLAEVLSDIPIGKERQIIAQVASAAQFLEELGLAHRDIKPENIGVSDDFEEAVLLDLGVLRPLDGYQAITDQGDRKNFVGTLQYSPPEMLFRVEEDTMEAWRAITFYQLGAVLYDLLVRRPLFADFVHPFARLVKAVDEELVLNIPSRAAVDLRQLAKDCLVKDWKTRLRIVTWERFQQGEPDAKDANAARDRIEQRRIRATIPQTRPTEVNETDIVIDLMRQLDDGIRDASHLARTPPYRLSSNVHDATGCVRVEYTSSEAHSVTSPFVIYLECKTVSLASRAVRIRAAAAISSGKLPEWPTESWLKVLIEGVTDLDMQRALIEEYVLFAYDAAARECEQSLVPDTAVLLHTAT